MKDIVSNFPMANEVREMNFELFLFEKELKNLFYLIAKAKEAGQNSITIDFISNNVVCFLIEKGFKVNAFSIVW